MTGAHEQLERSLRRRFRIEARSDSCAGQPSPKDLAEDARKVLSEHLCYRAEFPVSVPSHGLSTHAKRRAPSVGYLSQQGNSVVQEANL